MFYFRLNSLLEMNEFLLWAWISKLKPLLPYLTIVMGVNFFSQVFIFIFAFSFSFFLFILYMFILLIVNFIFCFWIVFVHCIYDNYFTFRYPTHIEDDVWFKCRGERTIFAPFAFLVYFVYILGFMHCILHLCNLT